jgi:Flp pilus assembly protein TadB
MRVIYTSRPHRAGPGRLWGAMLRLAVLISAALALLAITLVGLFVVLPLLLVGGMALHFYLRRRLQQPRQRPADGVIDAEYTVVDHR